MKLQRPVAKIILTEGASLSKAAPAHGESNSASDSLQDRISVAIDHSVKVKLSALEQCQKELRGVHDEL